VKLGERERFLDAQPGAPEEHDQRPDAAPILAGVAHDGDDLFGPRRIGQVALAFAAAEVVAGHARARLMLSHVLVRMPFSGDRLITARAVGHSLAQQRADAAQLNRPRIAAGMPRQSCQRLAIALHQHRADWCDGDADRLGAAS
jgi:hypothetical protein